MLQICWRFLWKHVVTSRTLPSRQFLKSKYTYCIPSRWSDIIKTRKQLLFKRNWCYGETILKTDVWKGFHNYAILLAKPMHVTYETVISIHLKSWETEISKLFKNLPKSFSRFQAHLLKKSNCNIFSLICKNRLTLRQLEIY